MFFRFWSVLLQRLKGTKQMSEHNDVEHQSYSADGKSSTFLDQRGSEALPYHVGNHIEIRLSKHDDLPASAHILNVLKPSSQSHKMVVRLNHPTLQDIYVLELYDRRFAQQLRTQQHACPWTLGIEAELYDLDASGDLQRLVEEWEGNTRVMGENWLEAAEWQRWSTGKQEAYLQFLSRRTYEREKSGNEPQTTPVPKVYANVWLSTSRDGGRRNCVPWLDIPGTLSEYSDDSVGGSLASVKPDNR